jgi:cell division septation protein DedD
MPQNEQGEFELVLGNKELLTVLFIVVVLLGVFFSMGYVVGRNSAPVETARRSEPYVRTDAPSAMPDKRPQTDTATPAQSARSPETAASMTAQRTTVPVTEPEPGQTFLQVSAVARPEAEILVQTLAKRGFRALLAPGPDDAKYRVLVGPAQDAAAIAKLRSELEQAGFRPFPKKY